MMLRRVLACLVTAFAILFAASSTVFAATPVYQIAFSNNCNNPSVCFDPSIAGSLGGDWGSVRLNSDGTGAAQLTMATHSSPPIPNGAQHLTLVLTWIETTTPPPGPLIATDPKGNYLVISVANVPLPPLVTPATPGHYKVQGAMFGMQGVNFMLQINAI